MRNKYFHCPNHKQLGLAKFMLAIFQLFALNSLMAQSGNWFAPTWADTLTNPLKNQKAAIESGRVLFNSVCISCHGFSGKGDGESGFGLNTPPRDLTDKEHAALTDGAVYWKITFGNSPMPAYQNKFTDIQRWQLVNYLRELQRIDKEAIEKIRKRKPKG